MRGTLINFHRAARSVWKRGGIALTSLYPPFKVRRFRRAAVEDLILNVDALEEANQPFEGGPAPRVPGRYPPRRPADRVPRRRSGAPARRGHQDGAQGARPDQVHVPLMGQCKRCLTLVRLDEPVELTRTYVPEEQAHAPESDAATIRGQLRSRLVDEDTLLGKGGRSHACGPRADPPVHPPAPLCREIARPLPTCGKDLNEGACGCDRSVIDPRWAALKGIQLQKKEK